MVKEGRTLADLQHSHVETPKGANIYVIDTGAVIDAEATAMLQALHSRSTGGLQHHLEELASRGADNFMKNFYVGYGHKSIGDCGTTTMFIEDVSMLAAKAIQDFPLYNGQEASTRYIDFSKQHFIDPTNSNNGFNIKESQRDFYMKLQDPVRAALKEEFPMQDGEKESIYDKAINARGFDITRGFLPAGATTNLAWHSNLRQVSDRLLFLRHHPLAEVREIAEGIGEAVKEMHPNSFSDKRYEASEAYQDEIAAEYYYHNPQAKGLTLENNISLSGIEDNRRLLEARPEKTELPKYLGQLGNIQAQFTLDYGSFRDIQRHRAINQRMPLLTTELGVNPWYMDSLPPAQAEQARAHFGSVESEIDKLNLNPHDAQYLTPMGYDISNSVTGDLPAFVYMTELRNTRFVHPTLRKVAGEIGAYIQDEIGIPMHFDSDPNRFDVKRGEHDIQIK